MRARSRHSGSEEVPWFASPGFSELRVSGLGFGVWGSGFIGFRERQGVARSKSRSKFSFFVFWRLGV